MNADVERIWTRASRDRNSNLLGRRTPSPGIRAVLAALAKEPAYGCEIARRTGQDQGNVCRWLRRLEAFGFVEWTDVLDGFGHQGGGRPAVFWELTQGGRELVEAMDDELAAEVA